MNKIEEQILKNQHGIMDALWAITNSTIVRESLDKGMFETYKLLNPTEKEKSSVEMQQEKTEDAFCEVGE